MKKLLQFISVLSVVAGISFTTNSYAGSQVIANIGTGLSAIDQQTLKKAFLGKIPQWPNGTTLTSCIDESDTAALNVFTRKHLGKSPSAFDAYWSRMLFSGKAIPPKPFESKTSILSYVSNTAGAICFISSQVLKMPDNVVLLLEE